MLEWVWAEEEDEEDEQTNLQILATKIEAINRQLEQGNASSEQADFKRILKLQRDIIDKLDEPDEEPNTDLDEIREVLKALMVLYNQLAQDVAEQRQTLESRLQNIERSIEDLK